MTALPQKAHSPNDAKIDRKRRGALTIMEAAERLFGQYGIDGVSTRRIIHAAGMINNSAVIYHFGDRAGLLQAIFEWRAPQLEAKAKQLYDEAEALGRLEDPATLLGIILLPFVEVRDQDGKHSHAAFMYQTMRSPEARSIRFSIQPLFAATWRALNRLADVLPDLPNDLLYFRLRLAAILFFDGLIEQDREVRAPEFPQFRLDDLLGELLQAGALLVTAPVETARL